MSDVVIPAELVEAQRAVDAAFAAVGTREGTWADVHEAAEVAHALRAPLVEEHGSWAVTEALSTALHAGDDEA